MTVPQRVAMTLPHKLGVKETMDLAVWAEERGYDDVWFADNSGIDALTTSAAVAVRTERVRIGTAIIPVYTRSWYERHVYPALAPHQRVWIVPGVFADKTIPRNVS